VAEKRNIADFYGGDVVAMLYGSIYNDDSDVEFFYFFLKRFSPKIIYG